MNIKSLVVAAASAVVMSSAAHASFITFTDRSAWEAAVGGSFSQEAFDDAVLSGFTIQEVGSGHSASISGGVYRDRTVGSSTFTNYNFSSQINSFGANWDLRPGGAGQGLQLFLGGQAVTPQIVNTFSGGFFGVVSTTSFNVVTVRSGNFPGVAETHNVDNVVFTSAVPEPESYALMLAGLGLVGAIARRRKAKNLM